ncbi:hypothetical protein SNF32_17090 [Enterococcus mundtii]|nr:hypothetical protein [Enterococcus mundtii]
MKSGKKRVTSIEVLQELKFMRRIDAIESKINQRSNYLLINSSKQSLKSTK